MNTLDRIIRVIYREIPLSKLMCSENDRLSSLDLVNGLNLNNNAFCELLIDYYIKVYPDNYSEDEVQITIDAVIDRIKENYQTSTIVYPSDVLIYVVSNILFLSEGYIKVRFEDLLELNGFINKIDNNILYSCKLALEKGSITKSIRNKKLVLNRYNSNRILHDNKRLTRILQSGIAENHMHFKGSGYTYDMNWYAFIDRPEKIVFSNLNKIKYDENTAQANDLLGLYKTRIFRYILSLYLIQHYYDDLSSVEDYKEILTSDFILKVLHLNNMDEYETFYISHRDKFIFSYNYFKLKFEELVREDDPKKYYLSERYFMTALFSIYYKNKNNLIFKYVFNLYLIGMNHFKMFFIQDNEGMGFRKFKYCEDIKEGMLSGYSSTDIYKTVIDKYLLESNVKSIEFRVGPKNSTNSYYLMSKQVDEAIKEIKEKNAWYKDTNFIYGFIVHYIKQSDRFELRDGISRMEAFMADLLRTSHPVSKLFDSYDRLDAILDLPKLEDNKFFNIIGIDTANYEYNCRPEVFGYLYRKQRGEISSVRKLGFTYHVGEDFPTLANGLRAIDEVIEFLNFSRGDRMGHALALGINCDQYFRIKRYKLITSIEEYLDDIVWMYYLISDREKYNLVEDDYKDIVETSEISQILIYLSEQFYKYINRHDLSELNKDLANITMYDYYCAYNLRSDDPKLYLAMEYRDLMKERKKKNPSLLVYADTLLGNKSTKDIYKDLNNNVYFKYKHNVDNKKHKECFLNRKARLLFLYYQYSEKYKNFHNKKEILEVDPIYIKAVKLSQLILRKKVYDLEISVESNPTSNRKISYIKKYIDLPFFTFNKKYLKNGAKYNIMASINTDDSAIFQTDLSLEYAHVVATLLREGFDKEDVYRYIDYVRDFSIKQTFLN